MFIKGKKRGYIYIYIYINFRCPIGMNGFFN